MTALKKIAIGLSIALLSTTCFAQQVALSSNTKFSKNLNSSRFLLKETRLNVVEEIDLNQHTIRPNLLITDTLFIQNYSSIYHKIPAGNYSGQFGFQAVSNTPNQLIATNKPTLLNYTSTYVYPSKFDLGLSLQENEPFFRNRRNVYSSIWAFASLNYLYADLVGLMDKNKLAQYQTGVVEGLKITPEFLTIAAGFMQIPLVNVFLPQIIKNENTLRWVQIASGTIMTLVQAGTLFVGKPTPYYALFSAFEIAATTYITIDAIKWKPNSSSKKIPAGGK
jgi:hypothetical protein